MKKSTTKMLLGVTAGIAVGGAVGYFVSRSRFGRQAADAIVDSGIRLPDPSFAAELAYEEEQFDLLDTMVCECGAPIINAAGEDETIDAITKRIQDCVAMQIYPDFPWPPVPGDHPSMTQLYAEIGLLARKAFVTGDVCTPQTSLVLPPNNQGIR